MGVVQVASILVEFGMFAPCPTLLKAFDADFTDEVVKGIFSYLLKE